MNLNTINVYTDGSLIRKGRLVLCGYGIYFPNGEHKPLSREYTHEPITNNRAELYAILKTIHICVKLNDNNNKMVIQVIREFAYTLPVQMYSSIEKLMDMINSGMNSTISGQNYGASRDGGRKHAGQDFDIKGNEKFSSRIGGVVKNIGSNPGGYGNYIDIYNWG